MLLFAGSSLSFVVVSTELGGAVVVSETWTGFTVVPLTALVVLLGDPKFTICSLPCGSWGNKLPSQVSVAVPKLKEMSEYASKERRQDYVLLFGIVSGASSFSSGAWGNHNPVQLSVLFSMSKMQNAINASHKQDTNRNCSQTLFIFKTEFQLENCSKSSEETSDYINV